MPSIAQNLVLLGGGHSHAIALRMFGMKPLPGVRLTLLTEASDTPYSGMLPGHVAGFYSHADCHIDLRPLARFAGADLYIDRAIGLDLANQRVLCANRPPVRFDWLSINIGSTPKQPEILGDPTAVIPAKPVRQFLAEWEGVVARIQANPAQPLCLGIVGGGAGGVELALTTQRRLQNILQVAGQPATNVTLHLFQRDRVLLPRHNRWVQQHLLQLLEERQIHLHLGETVVEVQPGKIRCESGVVQTCDAVLWVTQGAAPSWLGEAGLAVDADGFVLVDDNLRSLSHERVFAAGDIATMKNHPRPKAGVFAVRQGKPLFENLQRALQDKPLQSFRPQRRYLSLIGTADDRAIASWGAFGWHSSLLWQWKDRIDRQFMERFRNLPAMQMSEGMTTQSNTLTPRSLEPSMRCAGCGAKVGSTILTRALQEIQVSQQHRGTNAIAKSVKTQSLPPQSNELRSAPSAPILLGLNAPDDAAVLQIPPEKNLVQTVDYLPTLINDPFIFGQIAANHALSDIYAMGATPHSALAIATLPYAQPPVLEEILYQLLCGALHVLQTAGAELIGGHTTESETLAFGLSCNGLIDPKQVLRKSGMQPGDRLILTKPIGTGVLFAAEMRQVTQGSWIDGAIASMLQPNQTAAMCFVQHGATACTDITGFGLAGHLVEMMQASRQAIELDLTALPTLTGSLELADAGIYSSLYPENVRAAQWIVNATTFSQDPRFALLFDPQTSGGLLATVPPHQVDDCLTHLQALGYTHSRAIGMVSALTTMEPAIALIS